MKRKTNATELVQETGSGNGSQSMNCLERTALQNVTTPSPPEEQDSVNVPAVSFNRRVPLDALLMSKIVIEN